MTTAELLTVSELCEHLKVSPKTVYRLTESRALPFLKIGGGLRFRASDIEDYLNSQTVRPVVSSNKYGSKKNQEHVVG